MSDVVSFVEIYGQHAELLPARATLQALALPIASELGGLQPFSDPPGSPPEPVDPPDDGGRDGSGGVDDNGGSTDDGGRDGSGGVDDNGDRRR